VAGFDLLNEPDLRSVATDEQAFLGSFYARAIEAIRAGESRTPGGFHHIVFFEPSILWPRVGPTVHTPSPGFTDDSNIVFAPHLYAGAGADAFQMPYYKAIRQEANDANAAAQTYGTTVWAGEWSWPLGAPKRNRKIGAFARQQDKRLWGGAWWQWKQACGSPGAFTDGSDTSPRFVVGNLNAYRCRPSEHRLPSSKRALGILSRPYPLAAPGRLLRLRSHWQRASLRIRGRGAGGGGNPRLLAWFPRRGRAQPLVGGSNLSLVRVTPQNGGWLLSARVGGSYSLHAGYAHHPG
jgi:endoglycosylceramidase